MSTNASVKHEVEFFSVCVFYHDNTYTYEVRHVSADEAVKKFLHCTSCAAAKAGLVARVIITDCGDCINMEWQYEKGITYPPLPQFLDKEHIG